MTDDAGQDRQRLDDLARRWAELQWIRDRLEELRQTGLGDIPPAMPLSDASARDLFGEPTR